MPQNTRIRVDGLKALEARLKRLPPELQKKPIRVALNKAKKLVLKAAQRNLDATSKGTGTGVLRRNIKAAASRSRDRGEIAVDIGVEAGRVQRLTAKTGKTAYRRGGKLRLRKATKREKRGEDPFYYRFQELGYTAVGKRKIRGGNFRRGRERRRRIETGAAKFIKGRSFLGNALFRNTAAILNEFRQALADDIRKREAQK